MKWPLVWRSTLDAVQAELQRERARARRRERRAVKAAPRPIEREVPVPASAEDGELPEIVVEAIASRARLDSPIGRQMMRAAEKALREGGSPAAVAAWMLNGDDD